MLVVLQLLPLPLAQLGEISGMLRCVLPRLLAKAPPGDQGHGGKEGNESGHGSKKTRPAVMSQP